MSRFLRSCTVNSLEFLFLKVFDLLSHSHVLTTVNKILNKIINKDRPSFVFTARIEEEVGETVDDGVFDCLRNQLLWPPLVVFGRKSYYLPFTVGPIVEAHLMTENAMGLRGFEIKFHLFICYRISNTKLHINLWKGCIFICYSLNVLTIVHCMKIDVCRSVLEQRDFSTPDFGLPLGLRANVLFEKLSSALYVTIKLFLILLLHRLIFDISVIGFVILIEILLLLEINKFGF